MSAVVARPEVTPADRLGLTLCLAVIVHAVVILGVTFTHEDLMQPRYDTMEVVLVQQRTREKPKDAQLLAQASLEGAGPAQERVTPATPAPPPFPDNQPEVTSAQPSPPASQRPPADVSLQDTKTPPATPEQTKKLLTADADKAELAQTTPRKEKSSKEPAPARTEAESERPPLPTAAALLTNSFRIAALSAEIKQKLEAQAQRPRRKFISASTQEYKYAAYMEAWRAKVERVGNLNYPEEARRRNMSGSLILDVALNPDGSVNDIIIRHSSGFQVLDDAAIRIVHLAAPFAPFPDNIRKETDILHITRTWEFLDNQGFR